MVQAKTVSAFLNPFYKGSGGGGRQRSGNNMALAYLTLITLVIIYFCNSCDSLRLVIIYQSLALLYRNKVKFYRKIIGDRIFGLPKPTNEKKASKKFTRGQNLFEHFTYIC